MAAFKQIETLVAKNRFKSIEAVVQDRKDPNCVSSFDQVLIKIFNTNEDNKVVQHLAALLLTRSHSTLSELVRNLDRVVQLETEDDERTALDLNDLRYDLESLIRKSVYWTMTRDIIQEDRLIERTGEALDKILLLKETSSKTLVQELMRAMKVHDIIIPFLQDFSAIYPITTKPED